MDGFTQRKRPQGSDGDDAFADDAAYEATGSDRGSTKGGFKAAGCPLVLGGKMNAQEANGLALVR